MTENNRLPVTVLGIGMMGTALAGAFLNNGNRTIVWDRSANKADSLIAESPLRNSISILRRIRRCQGSTRGCRGYWPPRLHRPRDAAPFERPSKESVPYDLSRRPLSERLERYGSGPSPVTANFDRDAFAAKQP
ncbi:hypothetical protein J2S53_001337 [Actinopolyspora lacussalsi]|nr:hypothetical protein [Actinopolyspora lacussalsi]